MNQLVLSMAEVGQFHGRSGTETWQRWNNHMAVVILKGIGPLIPPNAIKTTRAIQPSYNLTKLYF
jgi:hypothetical protein